MLKFNEASRVFLAQRCGNKAGRYVSIVEYGEGCRRRVITVPKGIEGKGWNTLAECFQAVVDFLGISRKGSFSSRDTGRSGVSFADVVKKKPPPVSLGKVYLKLGGKSKIAVGSNVSFSHVEKKVKHAKQAADCLVPKGVAIYENAAIECSSESFYTKHYRTRLLGLKDEIDRLFKALSMMGEASLEGLGLSCKDCGVAA